MISGLFPTKEKVSFILFSVEEMLGRLAGEHHHEIAAIFYR
jgi:hypothetical protein